MLASNPPDLHLLNSWDYRHTALYPATISYIFKKRSGYLPEAGAGEAMMGRQHFQTQVCVYPFITQLEKSP
jgi:hypothetical protein